MRDNTAAFWRYNATPPWARRLRRSRRPRPGKPPQVRDREAAILRLLIEAEREPVHVRDIAPVLGASEKQATRFMTRNGEDLWTHVGSFTRWRTTLRDVPVRCRD